MLCCKDFPILFRGELVFVCSHFIPRPLKYEDGMYVLVKGERVTFNDLYYVKSVYTDRFGTLQNYSLQGTALDVLDRAHHECVRNSRERGDTNDIASLVLVMAMDYFKMGSKRYASSKAARGFERSSVDRLYEKMYGEV